MRAGYDGAVQLRDATQTAKSEREGELGDALPPEALAGLHVVAYAPAASASPASVDGPGEKTASRRAGIRATHSTVTGTFRATRRGTPAGSATISQTPRRSSGP